MNTKPIVDLVLKARHYGVQDPEVALTQARKAAEQLCRTLFELEVGEPGKIMLDAMLQKLGAQKVIPHGMLVPFGTIQAYGNFGTHAQSGAHTFDAQYVAPALAALDQVTRWFFVEYLKQPLPPELQRGPAAPAPATLPEAPTAARPRSSLAIPGVLALLALIGVGAWSLFRTAGVSTEDAGSGAAAAASSVAAPASEASTSSAREAEPDQADQARSKGGLELAYAVTAQYPSDAAPHRVEPNEVLHAGARMVFQFRASEAAHLYLAQRNKSTGELSVLFPHPKIEIENPVPAGQWVRIPPQKAFVLNDRDLGTETVFIVASRGPQPALGEVLAAASGSADGARRRAAEAALVAMAGQPAADCDVKTRALELEADDPCAVKTRALELPDDVPPSTPAPAAPAVSSRKVRAQVGDELIYVPFSFKHVKAP